MILAAGLGTRLKPLTDSKPKALVPVDGVPLLDINIRRLQTQGYGRFVVNVHHFAQQIIDHVKERYPQETQQAPRVLISDETPLLLETGGALKHAQQLFHDDQPILIHNVDILDNVDYDWFANQHQSDEDAVLLVSRRKTKRYLLFDAAMRLMGWMNVETGEVKSPYPWLRAARITIDDALQVHAAADWLSPSDRQVKSSSLFAHYTSLYAFAFSGIHSFSPRLFSLMERFPDRFSIIDFYLSVCHRARIVGLPKDDLRVLDVGKLDTLQEAKDFLASIQQ